MSKCKIIGAIMLLAGSLVGAEITSRKLNLAGDFSGNIKSKWVCHVKDAIKQVDGGRSGKCLEVITKEKKTSFREISFIPMIGGQDSFKISLYVKGKGKFSVSMACFNKKNKYSRAKGVAAKVITVDSAEEWVKYEFVYTPVSKSDNPARAIAKCLIQINTMPNSSLRYDDVEIIVERKAKTEETNEAKPPEA